MTTKKPKAKDTKLTADKVIEYLRANPNFLIKNPELIDVLLPPNRHSENRVVDMQHFMLRKLQTDNEKLRGVSDEMLKHARDNMQGQQRIHSAVITLLSAVSFEDLLQIIVTELPMHLGIDAVNLCIEADDVFYPANALSGIQLLEPGSIEDMIGMREVLIRSEMEGDTALFGGLAGAIQSDALIRLDINGGAPDGLLALGSRRADAMQAMFGGELLAFLGQVVEICIRNWLTVDIV